MNTYTFHNNLFFRSPAYAFDPFLSENAIKQKLQQCDVQEAIYLASPVLFREIEKYLRGELTDKKKIEKFITSVAKYLSRMSSRCTPFGMFAGCYSGQWSQENKVLLSSKTNTRHTRLDMNYLCSMAQALSKHPDLKDQLLFYPNTSIYVKGSSMRYVDYHYIDNRRIHQLSVVDNSTYLRKTLALAWEGALIKDLINSLVDDGISIEDATDFVNEIIDNQLLISELQPAVTGPEFTSQLLHCLQTKLNLSPPILNIVDVVKNVQQMLIDVDNNVINDPSIYEQIGAKLKSLNITFNENNLFQTDLFKYPQVALLHADLQMSLTNAFDFLNRLNPYVDNNNLKRFRENFQKKYEEREVSLMEALDPEIGIGYLLKDVDGINLLVDDLPYGPNANNWESEFKWNPLQNFLFQKLKEAHKNNDYTVVLTYKDLEGFENNNVETPLSMHVVFKVIDANTNKIKVNHFGGSSAVNLLGRFAHGNEFIHKTIHEVTAHEQDLMPNQLLAEIVHLPESRTGNILLRPVFRKYEIPYLAKSSVDKNYQIPVEDICISIKRERIFLRSKQFNKEIIPRLSSAHNFSNDALPVYQFLCDMQTQQIKGGVAFNWGVMAGNFNFLPRVEYNNVVLQPAEWRFSKKEDFMSLISAKAEDLVTQIAEFTTKWKLPDIVVLADGDNELLVNFKNEISLQAFIKTIRNRNSFNLLEFLFDPKTALVKDDQGKAYTHECIAILLRKEPKTEKKSNAHTKIPELKNSTPRSFFIGSEWLYYKIYCSNQMSDKLLTEVIKPLVEHLQQQQLIDKWFFIRYFDDDGKHIRLRLHMVNTQYIGSIINVFTAYFETSQQDIIVSKIVTDVYNREIERYGDNSMELSESFFCIDSSITLQMLSILDEGEGEEIRWLISLRLIDALLSDFKLTMDKKKELLGSLRTSFEMEFGNSKPMKLKLSDKYREARKKIENTMTSDDEALQPLSALIEQRSRLMKDIANEIMQLKEKGLLEVEMDSLLGSYIHMSMNRLFKTKQRAFELVIYHHLYRYYDSSMLRSLKRELT